MNPNKFREHERRRDQDAEINSEARDRRQEEASIRKINGSNKTIPIGSAR